MTRRTRRRALWWLAAFVAFNVVVALIASATRAPSGPPSSSYSTVPRGLAAWAELLRASGHPVSRLREAPGDRTLDPRTTVVVLEPDAVPVAEARALGRFVRRGGRLIAGGEPSGWMRAVLPRPPASGGGGLARAGVLAPVAEVAGVTAVRGASATWEQPSGALPALGRGDRSLLAVASVERGRVALLADAAPLQNRLLARADNAALGLALAGERGRPVVFAESYHGFGEERGVGALPGRWRWALALLALAGLVWVAAHMRRLGPAEAASRELPPPRRDYVDSLSATLDRIRSPAEAAAPLQAAARAALARRASLEGPVGETELARAARQLGLGPDEVRALSEPARQDADVLAAGRALARLNGAATGHPRT